MIKWEYKIVYQVKLGTEDEWNLLGEKGWQPVHFHISTGCFVFKRPIESTEISPQELEKMLQSESSLNSNQHTPMSKHIVTQEDIDEKKYFITEETQVGDEVEVDEAPEGETAA